MKKKENYDRTIVSYEWDFGDGFIMTEFPLLSCFFSKCFFSKEKFDANGKVYYDWNPPIKFLW